MKSFGFLMLGGIMMLGCTRQDESQTGAISQPERSTDGVLLSEEPAGAKTVIEVRETSKDQDEVVIVGRIGGSRKPFAEGRAAFTIVDQSLKACSDIPGDNCETPWDYCCETSNLPGAQALVKFVDADGNLIAENAKQWLKLKELQTVVVKGKAQREEGNLTVLATSLYVKP
ncbi:MAG TPA: hypothetical protein VMM56_09480 [Planctomycetaceae bacterium]|nr:hypothetical protein [Planctomycetaceae bacterium]